MFGPEVCVNGLALLAINQIKFKIARLTARLIKQFFK